MDGLGRKRKPPPIPKFQDDDKSNNKVTEKVTSFLNEIQKQSQQKNTENNVKPVQKKEQPQQTKKVKKASLNLNSKLNSLLSKKIDLNKMGQSIKKVNKTHESQDKKQVDVEYDPKVPNSYEQAKGQYCSIFQQMMKQKVKEEVKVMEEEENVENDMVQQQTSQLEEKESFALRMMQKHGYRIGEGLGKHKQGITTPLTIKKTTDSSCVIEPSSVSLANFISMEQAAENAILAHNVEMTKVIVLSLNMRVDEMQEETEIDIKGECWKFGQIIEWVLFATEVQMRIFVQYGNKQSAKKAFAALNDRYYDQKLISVYFYNEDQFHQQNLGLPFHVKVQF